MKIHINNPVHSTRMRVLSAFLAFLIFTLTFQEALVGWDFGMRAKAANSYGLEKGDGTISSSATQVSKYMGFDSKTESHNSAGVRNGTYTGRIKPVTVNMYDYLTDGEINGTWNVLNDADYTWYDRYDPYTNFNNAISNSGNISSSYNNNITLTVSVTNITSTNVPRLVGINVWTDSHSMQENMNLLEKSGNTYRYRVTFPKSIISGWNEGGESNTIKHLQFVYTIAIKIISSKCHRI